MKTSLVFALLGTGCTKDNVDSGIELAGPVLEHTPPTDSFEIGEAIPLTVKADDDDGVGGVSVAYREDGGAFWSAAELSSEDGLTWTVEIPGEDVVDPGMEYYFKAIDLNEAPSNSYLPEDIEAPFLVAVELVGSPLPYTQDFEIEEGVDELYGMGFASASEGFAGYQWDLSAAQAYSGETSAAHGRGVEGVPALDDWLISPPLDLTAEGRIQVTWWEYGQGVDAADHTLLISTGSKDPASGDYVELDVLDAPLVDTWERSMVVELSEYAGERAVYIAWRYRGEYADDWYIDDVVVRDMTIDLDHAIRWSPDPISPGVTGTLELDLINLVDVDGGELTVTGSFPDGGAAYTDDTLTLDGIDADGIETLEFEITIDGDTADHSYLPLEFVVSDGVDSWIFSDTLTVGYPSLATLELTLVEEALLQVELGVGDPEAPLWEEAIYNSVEPGGVLTLEEDITDLYELLPPGAGELRWYARITSDSQGRVDAFDLSYGDESFAATSLPSWIEGSITLVYLPEPPSPTLMTNDVYPATLAPGDEAYVLASFLNEGADTAGAVTVELKSDDGDVVIDSAGAMELTAEVWEGGAAVSGPTVYFTVSSGHVDSTPVTLYWELDDGVETWTLPFDAEVPWPVLKITRIDIDDSDGNNDGLLDAGESADLDIEVTNVGELDASGVVRGTLSIASSSTAVATTSGSSETIGPLGVDDDGDADFDIAVDASSSAGDTVDLVLTMTDSDTTYTSTAQLVLGEPPWLTIAPTDDDIGDDNGYTFDIVNGKYRSDGTTFELLMESADPYDSTAFVEMWCIADGDYSFLRMVLQSGTAKLQGYDSGFVTLATPTVTSPSSTEVLFVWDVADMAVDREALSCGFGSGWCTTETGNFCDHMPDGWGYYYQTWSSSQFYDLSW